MTTTTFENFIEEQRAQWCISDDIPYYYKMFVKMKGAKIEFDSIDAMLDYSYKLYKALKQRIVAEQTIDDENKIIYITLE